MDINRWRPLLFFLWRLINDNGGVKAILGLICLGGSVTVWTKCVGLKGPPRDPGTSYGPSIAWGIALRSQKIRAWIVTVLNVVAFVSYCWVWRFVPKDATEFPWEHHVATIWALCFACTLLMVGLLIRFLFKHSALKRE
jgi:hypothetical protein